jgi:hypothetical protein
VSEPTPTPEPPPALDEEPTQPPLWARIVGWLAVLAHLALFFWYVASGLVAPGWAVAVLLAIWAALLVVVIKLRRTHPFLAWLVPVFALAFWFGAISAGEAWLGWTA